MLPHAPGVQMQAIPEDAVQEDSGDEEEEDPNKRISSKYPPRLPRLQKSNPAVTFEPSADLQSALMTRG